MHTTILRRLAGVSFALLLLMSSRATASPITIVNTGPGPSTSSGLALYNDSDGFQWLAAEFLVAAPVTVTSAEGWIAVLTGGPMQLEDLCN